MKAIFGINVDNDKHNTTFDGERFIAAATPKELVSSLETEVERFEKNNKTKGGLGSALTVVKYITAFAAMICIIATLRNILDLSIAEMYSNAPGLYWAGGASAVVWIVLTLLERSRSRTYSESEEFLRSNKRIDELEAQAFAYLDVPEGVPATDVFAYRYVTKDGMPKCKAMNNVYYTNPSLRIYAHDGILSLADTESRFDLPLSAARSISRVNKRFLFNEWNKDEAYNSEKYAPYKVQRDNGFYCIKPGYRLIFDIGGEDYELLFPAYELETFKKLTGITEIN